MKTAVPTKAERVLSDAQKAALVQLLSDEDPAVFELVRNEILHLGPAARSLLVPHLLSADPLLRIRCQELVNHFDRQRCDSDFLSFCLSHGEDLDIEYAMWLLSRSEHPTVNPAGYSAILDSYAADLRAKLDYGGSARVILQEINDYLFEREGYRGNEAEYYDHQNSYLHRVIDRRTGNPISLCMIYMFLARRLRLPISGIGMPGHFLCRYQSSTEEIYVDAFNRGKLLTKADCVKYLLQTSHGFQESFLSPCSPLRILQRVCSNLQQIYAKRSMHQHAERLQRYLVALTK